MTHLLGGQHIVINTIMNRKTRFVITNASINVKNTRNFREEEGEDHVQFRIQRFHLHPTKLLHNFVSQNVFTN